MNYEQDIRIDPDQLDVEWLQQASLTFKYAEIVAKAKKHVDKQSERLAVKKAELDRDMRKDPESYGIEKITETAISNTIIAHEEYQDLKNELIEKQYEMEMAWAAVNSLSSKKSALENLVKLYGQNYFAGPKLPRDINKEWENNQKQKQVSEKIGENLTRRRRAE